MLYPEIEVSDKSMFSEKAIFTPSFFGYKIILFIFIIFL